MRVLPTILPLDKHRQVVPKQQVHVHSSFRISQDRQEKGFEMKMTGKSTYGNVLETEDSHMFRGQGKLT